MTIEADATVFRLPTVGVATIGHAGHGKTTLLAALMRQCAQRDLDRGLEARTQTFSVEEIAPDGRTDPQTSARVTIRPNEVEYFTDAHRVFHVDCPGRRRSLHQVALGLSQVDIAVLVVDAGNGAGAQTREHVLTACALGIDRLIVFLNKCDLASDPELIDLVEQEVRQILVECGLDGDDTTVIRGSARSSMEARVSSPWHVPVIELMHALDREAALCRKPAEEGTFHLLTLHTYRSRSSKPAGTPCVVGRVQRGVVTPLMPVRFFERGMVLENAVRDRNARLQVHQVQMFGRVVERAGPGDFVGLSLRTMLPFQHRSREVIGREGSLPAQRFRARVRPIGLREGGRRFPFFTGHSGLYMSRSLQCETRLVAEGDAQVIMADEESTIILEFARPVLIHIGEGFAFRNGCDARAELKQSATRTWGGLAMVGTVLAALE